MTGLSRGGRGEVWVGRKGVARAVFLPPGAHARPQAAPAWAVVPAAGDSGWSSCPASAATATLLAAGPRTEMPRRRCVRRPGLRRGGRRVGGGDGAGPSEAAGCGQGEPVKAQITRCFRRGGVYPRPSCSPPGFCCPREAPTGAGEVGAQARPHPTRNARRGTRLPARAITGSGRGPTARPGATRPGRPVAARDSCPVSAARATPLAAGPRAERRPTGASGGRG